MTVAFRKVSTIDDIWDGEMRGLIVAGKPILLVHVAGSIHAYADVCPHQRSRLSQGCLQGRVLTCATHHWQFDIASGKGTNPDNVSLQEVPVKVENDDILLDIDAIPVA